LLATRILRVDSNWNQGFR